MPKAQLVVKLKSILEGVQRVSSLLLSILEGVQRVHSLLLSILEGVQCVHSLLLSILEGVQRVPSLLLSCPTRELKQFNLQRYSILSCEPFHDLKAHLNNLLPNVPTLLTSELKTHVHNLIQRCVYWKDSGHTGADMRVAQVCYVRIVAKMGRVVVFEVCD